jgi:hypothetical protein
MSTERLARRLSLKRNRAAGQSHQEPVSALSLRNGLSRFRFQAWIPALRNLLLHAVNQHHEFFRLVVSFGLLAHLLEVLGSVGNTIRHWGMILDRREVLAYSIARDLPSP